MLYFRTKCDWDEGCKYQYTLFCFKLFGGAVRSNSNRREPENGFPLLLKTMYYLVKSVYILDYEFHFDETDICLDSIYVSKADMKVIELKI